MGGLWMVALMVLASLRNKKLNDIFLDLRKLLQVRQGCGEGQARVRRGYGEARRRRGTISSSWTLGKLCPHQERQGEYFEEVIYPPPPRHLTSCHAMPCLVTSRSTTEHIQHLQQSLKSAQDWLSHQLQDSKRTDLSETSTPSIFENMYRKTRVAFLLLDLDGHIRDCNPMCSHLFHLPESESFSLCFSDLLPGMPSELRLSTNSFTLVNCRISIEPSLNFSLLLTSPFTP